ncbi:MAG: T9SS C-terminal target domain-containing protein [Calditrichaeota bacterium]|nr:MAG: T9SS C-terminal target domain-containing protein [Calditrichota bacterium]
MRISCHFIILLLSAFLTTTTAQESARTGWWKFDNPADLLGAEAGYGSPLELVGKHQATEGPVAENGAVRIGIGSYYKMQHGMAANGGGSLVNEFTFHIDFKIRELGIWHTFFQISANNGNDGDSFINPQGNIGVGDTGYSGYAVKTNEWYRLVISVKNGSFYRYYLDGQLLHNGNVQSVDGRFGLAKLLLIFADNDREDGEIDCAELAVWDYALTADEVASLGGFGHNVASTQLLLVPYLQTPTPHSICISWHDTSTALTRVEYGLTPTLGQNALGSSEMISEPYRWHTVQLIGLQADTEYYYKVVSGSGSSDMYSFRTFPQPGYNGKLRFLMLSDTHSGDTTMTVQVIKAAKEKMKELYGNDIHNQIQAVLHSGDIVLSGNSITQYTDEFFAPMALLSPYIPTMITIGNHEGESPFYYQYVKYDDFPVQSPMGDLNEKMWSFTVANTMVIGLNTNLVSQQATKQKNLLDAKLLEAENDAKIDFVFLMFHHTPFTEVWGEALTLDGGPSYITNQLFPVIKKYSKVVQATYGHTHAFERGTIESNDERGDFRIVCAGGGGGLTDRWGVYINRDYPQIHVSLDHYFFLLAEIDVAAKSVQTSMYSLGNSDKPYNVKLLDQWHRKLNQAPPAKPSAAPPSFAENKVILNTSSLNGADSLMTIRVQASMDSLFAQTSLDTLVHWKNVYHVDAEFNPIDQNAGIDLTALRLASSRFNINQIYYYRVKYRDHNLRWSEWSNAVEFYAKTGIEDIPAIPLEFYLGQNYPNPFNPTTMINYQIPKPCHVSLRVVNVFGQEVQVLVDAKQTPGYYQVLFDASPFSAGVYYYRLQAEEFVDVRKMTVVK